MKNNLYLPAALFCCMQFLAVGGFNQSAFGQINSCTPWPATDGLGRETPLSNETGLPKADRFVGIFYFLWHGDAELPRVPEFNGPYDVSKILAKDPAALKNTNSPLWGPPGMPHYWGESLFGYYSCEDPWVLRRHAHLLADAGIDTLIFDTTNAVTYKNVYMKLCEVFAQIRREGGRTPQISFMVNTEAGKTAQEIFNDLYKPGLYRELWFQWQGKPLLICDPAQATPELRQFFTLRRAHWPFTLVNTPYAWHWETTYPQVYGYTDDPKKPEQVNVAVSQNLRQIDGQVTWMSRGDARGRSFHDGKQDATPGAVNYGHNFQEQWGRAFSLNAPFVMVTGWNEWIAGRMEESDKSIGFCDQYNQEFSRDIEPMRGGHADNYYWQLVSNVRRFKGSPALPKASSPKTIDINGGFQQWRDVEPEFSDHVGETAPRDFKGVGGLHYTNRTGRNDFVALKVARDEKNIYFYARTQQPISNPKDANWMWLLIDADKNSKTGRHGCEFIVNRTVEGNGKTWLESCSEGGAWTKKALLDFRVEGNELQIAVPQSAIGMADGKSHVSFNFKWADNIQQPDDPMDFYLSGDTAPDARFMYRYVGE